jgi:hypothetical protein
MSAAPHRVRIEISKERKVFTTQHQCLIKVTRDGYLFESLVVCGLTICFLCSSKYGNEGIFHCQMHSEQLTGQVSMQWLMLVVDKQHKEKIQQQSSCKVAC